MFVLFAEPLIFVLLGAAMAVEYSPLIGIVVAAILMIGPLSTLISDRRSRPEMVTIDNHGLTFEFSDGRRDYAGWNEVRLIPRSRSAPAKRGGFALNSEVGRAYRLSREVLAFAADSEEGLPESLEALRRSRPAAAVALDGWGRAIRYERLSETSFRLRSAGPDGVFDTDDDIVKDF